MNNWKSCFPKRQGVISLLTLLCVHDEKSVIWNLSVVDIIAELLQQSGRKAARNYLKVFRNRLNKEGDESVTNCNRLKLEAADGKKYLTDVVDPKNILRVIQSVPSPKAEAIKLWLAEVGYERVQNMGDSFSFLDQVRKYRKQHGPSERWIQQRMMQQETHKKLTGYRQEQEIKGEDELAILTNISIRNGVASLCRYCHFVGVWRLRNLSAQCGSFSH